MVDDLYRESTCEKEQKILDERRKKEYSLNISTSGDLKSLGFWMSQPGKASVMVIGEKIYAIMSVNRNYKGKNYPRTYMYTAMQIFPVKLKEESLHWVMRNVNLVKEIINGDEEAIKARAMDVIEKHQYLRAKWRQMQGI